MTMPATPGLELPFAGGVQDRRHACDEIAALRWMQPGGYAAGVKNSSDLYDSVAVQIERENSLINHRQSWTLQINGFLFTAMGLLAGKTELDPNMLLFAGRLLPLTGLFVSVAGFIGVVAAQMQIGYLANHWEQWLQADPRPRPFGARNNSHMLGIVPSVLPTAILIAVWGTLLLRKLFE